MRLETIHLKTITIRLINKGIYHRYCVNITDTSKLLHITAPAVSDKINRQTLPIWKKESRDNNSTTWIPIDIILEKVDRDKLPDDLKLLVDAGQLQYDPYVSLIEALLRTGNLKWSDLEPTIQEKIVKFL